MGASMFMHSRGLAAPAPEDHVRQHRVEHVHQLHLVLLLQLVRGEPAARQVTSIVSGRVSDSYKHWIRIFGVYES